MRSHPRDSLLREIFRSSGKAVDRLVEHVEGCAKCRQRVVELKEQEGVVRLYERREENYGPAFDRAFEAFRRRQATLDMERSEAPALLSRLLGLTPERQRLLLNNSQRFQTWGLLELLIDRGREETFTDPEHAEEILRLALDIAGRLHSSTYGSRLIEDMRARSWGYIANTRRARRELVAAEEAFGEAFMHLGSGSGDLLERAVLWDLEASLRRSQQNFEEAIELSRQASSTFRRVGEFHRLGKTLTNMACAYSYSQRDEQAVSTLYEALGLIDPAREPRLAFYALHNLVDALVVRERFGLAQKVLDRARPLYKRFSTPFLLVGYTYFQVKISEGLGRPRDRRELSPVLDFTSRHKIELQRIV